MRHVLILRREQLLFGEVTDLVQTLNPDIHSYMHLRRINECNMEPNLRVKTGDGRQVNSAFDQTKSDFLWVG